MIIISSSVLSNISHSNNHQLLISCFVVQIISWYSVLEISMPLWLARTLLWFWNSSKIFIHELEYLIPNWAIKINKIYNNNLGFWKKFGDIRNLKTKYIQLLNNKFFLKYSYSNVSNSSRGRRRGGGSFNPPSKKISIFSIFSKFDIICSP